ncbi:hypothetical protein IWC96_14575 [Brevundimonas sp. BAL450]|uniref:hypothetical protein n=1 Tax=Brevundimonas sp. BAL450 TaxID=1708162 RepID=UPI0018C926D6|nr:hypothetical protein [Brevundimonas sp. BAL450]MBG7616500.1 hypothetical protein [Brevundimonas sp. BAL450]
MSNIISDFERECSEAGVQPHHALKAGGVHDSLWWKWRDGSVSPTLRSLERARSGLRSLIETKAA